MEVLTIVAICFIILVFLALWVLTIKESITDLKHIIKVLKYRKNLKYMTKEERKEFLKGK